MSRYIGDISSIFWMSVDPDTILSIDNQLGEKSKKRKKSDNVGDISPMYLHCIEISEISMINRDFHLKTKKKTKNKFSDDEKIH